MQRGPAPSPSALSEPRRKGLAGVWQGIKQNPHQFLLVLIGIVTLYVTYRIWKSHSAGSASASSSGLVPVDATGQPNWGTVTGSGGQVSGLSGGGSSSGGNGFPFTPTLTPPLHESVYQNASNDGTAKSWYTSVGETLAQIAAKFGIGSTAAIEYNPHNAMYHYNDNSVVKAGTDIWIPQSQIPSGFQAQYNNSLGGGAPLSTRNPTDPLP